MLNNRILRQNRVLSSGGVERGFQALLPQTLSVLVICFLAACLRAAKRGFHFGDLVAVPHCFLVYFGA